MLLGAACSLMPSHCDTEREKVAAHLSQREKKKENQSLISNDCLLDQTRDRQFGARPIRQPEC